ncbi:hypothetical protein F5Y05DRAFT_418972 [Hypoxylon sp. FL0543]|nr:hypothetical protein F5Y05DRAFT_418972 [Hypoxylon sp. FL0543]
MPPKGTTTGWSEEETTKLLLIIMQEGNPELTVKGWKSIGEKITSVFGDKYSLKSAQKHYQKLRHDHMKEIHVCTDDTPITRNMSRRRASANAEDDEGNTPVTRLATRTAGTYIDDDDEYDDEYDDDVPNIHHNLRKRSAAAVAADSIKRARPNPKPANGGEMSSNKENPGGSGSEKPSRLATLKFSKGQYPGDSGGERPSCLVTLKLPKGFADKQLRNFDGEI